MISSKPPGVEAVIQLATLGIDPEDAIAMYLELRDSGRLSVIDKIVHARLQNDERAMARRAACAPASFCPLISANVR